MIDALVHIDQLIFHWINTSWTHPLLDVLMPILRGHTTWIPVYVFIILFFIINYGRAAYYPLLFLILTVVLADNVSSQLIKKNVERLRPCRNETLIDKKVRVRCGNGFSFTSSHATNHFALSMFLVFLFRKYHRRWVHFLLIFWASAISLAQVYVGVHYPFDVLCGALTGSLIALIAYTVYERYFARSGGDTSLSEGAPDL